MRLLPLLALPLAVACNKDGGTSTTLPDPSCDDIVAAPLTEVEVTDWPEGLPEALGAYGNIGGRYETSSNCGSGTVAVKLIPATQEELLIVTETWAAAEILTCGCTTDPKFGDDTEFDIAAQIPAFEFFVETFGDPGIDNQNVVGSGALYSPGAPMTMRECGSMNVDPILGSAYDQFTTIVRLEDGLLTGSLSLARTDGTAEACDLEDWVLIEGL